MNRISACCLSAYLPDARVLYRYAGYTVAAVANIPRLATAHLLLVYSRSLFLAAFTCVLAPRRTYVAYAPAAVYAASRLANAPIVHTAHAAACTHTITPVTRAPSTAIASRARCTRCCRRHTRIAHVKRHCLPAVNYGLPSRRQYRLTHTSFWRDALHVFVFYAFRMPTCLAGHLP